jgi:CRP-like cAMP-binding protein
MADGTAEVVSEFGQIVDTIQSQEWFGEVAPLQNVPRTASIVAKTPCRTYVIENPSLQSIFNDAPELKKFIDDKAKIRMQAYLERCVLA